MSFPLYFLLFAYFIFLAVWIFFSFVSFYHISKFGVKNFTMFFAVFIYFAIAFLIFVISYDLIIGIDWGVVVSLSDGFSPESSSNYINY